MELKKGRPQDTSRRLEKEIRVYDFLDGLGVEYERIDHPPANNMAACVEIDNAPRGGIKNLFLCNRQQTKFYVLMLLGDKKFRTAEISPQIGSARLSFAGEEAMLKYLDITPGSVSVMGLLNDKNHEVELLIDEDVVKEEYIRCHPCINTSTLRIKTKDFQERILPCLGYEPIYVQVGKE